MYVWGVSSNGDIPITGWWLHGIAVTCSDMAQRREVECMAWTSPLGFTGKVRWKELNFTGKMLEITWKTMKMTGNKPERAGNTGNSLKLAFHLEFH